MTNAEIIALVEKLHDDFGTCEPEHIDLREMCASLGLFFRHAPLDDEEAHLVITGAPFAIADIAERTRGGYKEAFSRAHELGHWLLHRTLAPRFDCTGIGRSKKWSPRREIEADLFASAFTLPRPVFAPMCDHRQPTLRDLSGLSDRFRVSLSATSIRYAGFATSACAIACTRDGRIVWSHKSASFVAPLEKGYRIGGAAFARLVFAGERPPDSLLHVDPAAWGLGHTSVDLFEHARAIKGTTTALSLLWHPS